MSFQAAAKAVFPRTIPIMTGYIFMGMAFGILLQSIGYDFKWAALMAVTIYAGAMQFVAVNILSEPANLFSVFLVTLMVNARHIFYGLSMLEKFKNTGKAKGYLIFAMTDETFSLLCSTEVPKGLSPKSYYSCVSVFNHFYWVCGCVAGGLIGSQLDMDVTGIDFVMTALFVAIFIEQWRNKANRIPALIGFGAPALCLIIFGPKQFMIPSMSMMVLLLTLLRSSVERRL